jgi:hypothetical protein
VDFNGYVASIGRNGVRGWLLREDAWLLEALDAAQRRAGVAGDILEIGTYYGASAIALGYLLAADEELVVCDLFGLAPDMDPMAPTVRLYGATSFRADFERNYARYHDRPPVIHECASAALDPVALGRRFRIVHIDGSHTYEATRADILLAKQLLVPGGAIVIDDLVSRHFPDVAAAIWEAVMADGLVPSITTSKLYGSFDAILDVEMPTGFRSSRVEILGHMVRGANGPATGLKRLQRGLRRRLRRFGIRMG